MNEETKEDRERERKNFFGTMTKDPKRYVALGGEWVAL